MSMLPIGVDLFKKNYTNLQPVPIRRIVRKLQLPTSLSSRTVHPLVQSYRQRGYHNLVPIMVHSTYDYQITEADQAAGLMF